MAGIAGDRSVGVVVVDVALHADESGMLAGEGIFCVECVIEFSVEPTGGGVARTAIMWKAQRDVRGVIAGVELPGVAGKAGCRRALVDVVDMARLAREGAVHSGESEAGVFEMVKAGAEPTVHGVAALAGGWEACCNVIDYRSLKVFLMAGNAGSGESGELTCCSTLVAGFAINKSVRADKREAVLMVFDCLDGDVPSLDGVAVFAVRTHLAAMDIGMAVGAML